MKNKLFLFITVIQLFSFIAFADETVFEDESSSTNLMTIPVQIEQSGPDSILVTPLQIPQTNGKASEFQFLPSFTLMLSYPQIVSAKLGVLIANSSTPEASSGLLVELEGGLIGGELSVGPAIKGDVVLGPIPIKELALTLTGLYSWNVFYQNNAPEIISIRPGDGYLGPQLQLTSGIIRFSFGYLFKILGQNNPTNEQLLVLGLGISF